MIEIRSYLRDGDKLVPIELFAGDVRDPRYIEGAIDLTVNSIPLLTTEMWDYVDQLWEYLLDAVLKAADGVEASLFFPDQPIEVKVRPAWNGKGVELEVVRSVGSKRASLPLREFLDAFCEAGTLFFERTMKIVPENEAGDRQALAKIGRLRATSHRL